MARGTGRCGNDVGPGVGGRPPPQRLALRGEIGTVRTRSDPVRTGLMFRHCRSRAHLPGPHLARQRPRCWARRLAAVSQAERLPISPLQWHGRRGLGARSPGAKAFCFTSWTACRHLTALLWPAFALSETIECDSIDARLHYSCLSTRTHSNHLQFHHTAPPPNLAPMGMDSHFMRGPLIARHPPSTQTPPKRGLCIYKSTARGGTFKIPIQPRDSIVDAIRGGRGAAQCTASLFAAATAFFGSVSSSTPSLYLAWAVASSTSWASENARWIMP